MVELYSNESVFRGHPDKVCDQISSAILDACLVQDKKNKGRYLLLLIQQRTTKNIAKLNNRVY